MDYTLRCYFDDQKSCEEQLWYVYNFLLEIKTLSPVFAQWHFPADSEQESRKLFLNMDRDGYLESINHYHRASLARNGIKLKETKFYIFSIWNDLPDSPETSRVEIKTDDQGMSMITLHMSDMPESFFTKEKTIMNSIILAALHAYPVKFMTDICYEHFGDCPVLRVGWSIYANPQLLRPIHGFPYDKLAPDLARVATIEGVFDQYNSKHIDKARELDSILRANAHFVRETGYF